jgi:hypothetical protein
MELFGLVCVSAYCAVAFLVALHLLRLAGRTGQLPELLIGLSLLVGGGLGYPGSVAARALASSSPDLASRLAVAGMLGLAISAWTMLLCWNVIYHRGQRGSSNAVIATTAVLFVFLVERLATIDASGRATSSVGYVGWLLAGALPYAFNAASGLRYYTRMSRRVALGLADPVVANRILLWSVTSLIVVAQYAYSLCGLWLGPAFAALSTAVIGSLGLGIALLLALAFFPPQPFSRWVQARAGS